MNAVVQNDNLESELARDSVVLERLKLIGDLTDIVTGEIGGSAASQGLALIARLKEENDNLSAALGEAIDSLENIATDQPSQLVDAIHSFGADIRKLKKPIVTITRMGKSNASVVQFDDIIRGFLEATVNFERALVGTGISLEG